MLSTDSLVRELFLVCQLAIGYQLAKNQLASDRPIGNWCQLASNWPIGLDWQLAGRARFFWIGLAIGWPTKNYLSNWATLNGAINKKTSKIEVIFEQSNQIESYKKASEEQGERLRSWEDNRYFR